MTRLSALATALFLSVPAFAQSLELPPLSPRAMVKQQIGIVHVTVDYASPGKRDRTIWGELVPYGELWRTGANAATTLETTGDITVGGQEVPEGRYAVFTLPGEDSWTVILNKNPDQGGTGSYDEALDQARFTAKPQKGPARERLTFLFTDTTATAAALNLEWDGVRVSLPIAVDTDAQVAASITSYAASTSRGLANAARHFADKGDVDRALGLIDTAIAIEPTWFNTWLKADWLYGKGERKEAYKLAQQAHEMGAKVENFFWKERVEKALAEWKRR